MDYLTLFHSIRTFRTLVPLVTHHGNMTIANREVS